jgi:hypothetical protein
MCSLRHSGSIGALVKACREIKLTKKIEKEDTMEITKENAGQIEAQFTQWGATLDQLIAKAGAEAKSDYIKSLNELKSKYQAAQVKFTALKAVTQESWANVKSDFETAWLELETTFKRPGN